MSEEETKKTKKEEVRVVKTVVVTQLPTVETDVLVDNEGNQVGQMLTANDALTEILEIARQLKKGLL